jgi:hypothetical protein
MQLPISQDLDVADLHVPNRKSDALLDSSPAFALLTDCLLRARGSVCIKISI